MDFLDSNGLAYLWNKIKNLMGKKADLVDGKIPAEQLPETGSVSMSDVDAEIAAHNESTSAHSDIRETVADTVKIGWYDGDLNTDRKSVV